MKVKTKVISAIVAIIMVIGIAIPAFAENFTVYYTGDIVNVSELQKGDVVYDGDLIWNDSSPVTIYVGKSNQSAIEIIAEGVNYTTNASINSDGVSILVNNNAKAVNVDTGFCYVLDASLHGPEKNSGATAWVVANTQNDNLVLRAIA